MVLGSEYDVVVVGAGPGGSATARKCAELGLKTALLEKRQEIGIPVRCGEGLSIYAVQALGMVDKLPRQVYAQEIDGAIVYSPNGKKVVIDFGETVGYILERKMYDAWLAQQAARKGAYVQAKTEITQLVKEQKNGETYITGVKGNFESDDFEIKCNAVVGADGVEGRITRMAGLRSTLMLKTTDSGYQYEMVDIEMEDPRKLIIYFGSKISPRGYVWIFPKGDDRANVGIGIGSMGYEKTAKQYLDAWIATQPGIRKGSIVNTVCGGIPVGGFLKNMVLNGFAAVGDAAHQVNPIHGGGIGEAQRAGYILGHVLAEAKQKNDFSAKALATYNERWWTERGNMLRNVEKVREVMEKIADEDMDMLADSLDGETIMELCHGKRLSVLAKVLMKKPSLLKLATALV
ncbi:MAG: NAD(P)/FAD-dependent oxidoreductase [Candidatus Aenigmatarchaeota archaeon]|nr:MAG: NAD(P)/FAD-dependent oxidoreductase [Candidatus Aenigmarchaeota archaeon]